MSAPALRTARDLVASRLLDPQLEAAVTKVSARYAVAVSPHIASLIDAADPADPIARQFLPDPRELLTRPEERADPIGDDARSPAPGIVHRYADRLLLKIASVCPVYCRFCFRREMVGPQAGRALTAAEFEAAITYIRSHPEIWEVIMTGGDPFILSPRRIREVTLALAAIPHVKILRWHTRVPVVDPGRVDAALITALKSSANTVVVALHANHPRELTPQARRAIALIADAGIGLLSQTVLLKGVNDDAGTLEALMRAFVENRVKPYYLHHGDLAPGTSHLRTTIAAGQALMAELRRRLSGLALPTYVLDIPGGYGKVPISDAYLSRDEAQQAYLVRDPSGRIHTYRDVC